MAANWILTDTFKDVHLADWSAPAGDLPQGCSARLRTLGGGLRAGVEVLEIDNGAFRFTVLPQRGMSVWRAQMGEVKLGWNSPVKGPVHPAFVPVAQPDGLGWLQGFDELLVRCGLESNGAPDFDDKGQLKYPLHGRIGNLPAHRLEVSFDAATKEIVVYGEVDEAKLHMSKLRLRTTYRTKPGEPGVRISDEIVNLSGSPGACQMLYHINFGPPLCQPGSRVFVPIEAVSPRNPHATEDLGHWDTFGPARAGFGEQVYLFKPLADVSGNTQALLKDAASKTGVSLHWSTKQLGVFTLWKNTPSLEDGYVTGLEPGTNFPNPRSFETAKKRVVELAPCASHRMDLAIVAHGDAAGVARAEKAIAAIQATADPKIHKEPNGEWAKLA